MPYVRGCDLPQCFFEALGLSTNGLYELRLTAKVDDVVRLEVKRYADIDEEGLTTVLEEYVLVPKEDHDVADSV